MVEFRDLFNRYMEIVEKISKFIPYGRLSVWKEFFLNPIKTLSARTETLKTLIVDLYVYGFIVLILAFIGFFPQLAITLASSLSNASLLFISFGLAVLAIVFVLWPLPQMLIAIIEFVIAKILKGQATFTRHFQASAMPGLATFAFSLPLLALSIPFNWLSFIPVVSCCTSLLFLPIHLLSALLYVYSLYLKWLSFREVHKVGDLAAAAIVLSPIIIAIIAVVVLYFLFFAAIIGTGLSGAALSTLIQR